MKAMAYNVPNGLSKGGSKKENRLYNEIDQNGRWVSSRNQYFLKPFRNSGMSLR